MPYKKLVVAAALLSVAAAAQAGFAAILPEPATVTLIFICMAAIGLVVARKRPKPVES